MRETSPGPEIVKDSSDYPQTNVQVWGIGRLNTLGEGGTEEGVKKELSNSFECQSNPFVVCGEAAVGTPFSSQGRSTISSSTASRSSSLFARLAQRRSQTSLQVRHNIEVCMMKSQIKFTTPKIVRANTMHIREEGKRPERVLRFSGSGRGDYSSGQKPSKSQPHRRPDEINRIFKANNLKRKIGFDILLDNYKERMKLEKRSSEKVQATFRLNKVFAAGKFIGYLKTKEKERPARRQNIGNLISGKMCSLN